jgi:hypothetical protein
MPASWKAWFLESQGPPEWGIVILGPYRVAEREIFLAGAIVGGLFLAGNIESEIYLAGLLSGQIYVHGPAEGEASLASHTVGEVK